MLRWPGGFVPFDGNDREEDLMIQNIRERFIDVISEDETKVIKIGGKS